MFYAYFLFQLFLIILLSPIRWTINLTARFLWKPEFKFKPELFKSSDKNLKEHANQIHEELKTKIEKIKNAGDAVKFISIWYVATKDKEVLELVKSYIKDGKLNSRHKD